MIFGIDVSISFIKSFGSSKEPKERFTLKRFI